MGLIIFKKRTLGPLSSLKFVYTLEPLPQLLSLMVTALYMSTWTPHCSYTFHESVCRRDLAAPFFTVTDGVVKCFPATNDETTSACHRVSNYETGQRLCTCAESGGGRRVRRLDAPSSSAIEPTGTTLSPSARAWHHAFSRDSVGAQLTAAGGPSEGLGPASWFAGRDLSSEPLVAYAVSMLVTGSLGELGYPTVDAFEVRSRGS